MATATYTAGWEQEIVVNPLQFPCAQRMPAKEDRASRLPELTGACRGDEGKRSRTCAPVFMLVMAAICAAREIGGWLVGDALLVRLGLTLDPFTLSVVVLAMITLIGIGLAICLSKATPEPAARGQMLLALLVAMAIGLILIGLSHFVGRADALDWPLVPVYLLWAWVAAVSAA